MKYAVIIENNQTKIMPVQDDFVLHSVHDDHFKALNASVDLPGFDMVQANKVLTSGKMIECNETKEQFNNMTKAAQHANIALSAMSNHINYPEQYTHIKGKTYKRI